MKLRVLLGYLVFILSLLSLTESSAKELIVCKDCSYTSLKSAISKANSGDRIVLKKGEYKEHDIIIDKSVDIIGEEGAIIDGEMKAGIMIISADSVTVSGLIIKNVGTSFIQDYAAIKVRKSHYVTIENNRLQNVFFGIFLEKSKHGIIKNNHIESKADAEYNSGNGIHLWYCKNILIKENEVSGLRDGIYLEFVDGSTITQNKSNNNLRYGLHFMFSNNDEYSHNVFEKNGAGVAVMFSKKIKMFRNIFRNNWGNASYGLLLKEINDAEILENTFDRNTVGIHVEGSNRINYLKNNFIHNGWAVKIQGACFENNFNNNNFLFNTFEISYNGQLNNNNFDKNYWSSYSGYDLNKDGIGDIPYRPVKLFSYVVNRTPETIVLLRSLFIDIINFSEKVSPAFTPDNLMDNNPLTKEIK